MANNIAVSVTADVGGLVAGMAVAKEAAKDYGKEMRALARAVKDGDTSQETKARLFEVSEAYAKATATAALYDREIRKVQTSNAAANDNAGQLRAGMQNLGFQLQDVAVQFASGQRAGTIFAQQLPQISGALTQMAQAGGNASGLLGRFATFMSGPWGVAVGVGTAVLAPFIAKLFETKGALDSVGNAAETAMNKLHQSLAQSSTVSDAMTEATKKYATASAALAQGQRELSAALASQSGNAGQGSAPGLMGSVSDAAVSAARAKIAAAKKDLDDAKDMFGEIRGLGDIAAIQEQNRARLKDKTSDAGGSRSAGRSAARAYREGFDDELRALQKTTDKIEATVFKPLADRTKEDFQRRDEAAAKFFQERLVTVKRANAAELAETRRFEEQKRAIQERTYAPFAQSLARMLTLQRGFLGTLRDLWGNLTGIVEQAVARMITTWLVGLAAQDAAEEKSHFKKVFLLAKQAAARAWNAVVGIPIIGPVLAPAAAAVAFAGVMAFASAEDGWDVPGGGGAGIDGRGGRPAIIHPREMVLPAQIADSVRALPGGLAAVTSVNASLRGASASVADVNTGALDAPSIRSGGRPGSRRARSSGSGGEQHFHFHGAVINGSRDLKRFAEANAAQLSAAGKKYARMNGR